MIILNFDSEQLSHIIQNAIRNVLSESSHLERSIDSDRWFDINELRNYLPDKPSKMTVYGWVHDRSIPFHKGAKKLRFLKSEIDSWLRNGKKDFLSGKDIIPEHLLKTKVGKK